MSELTKEFTDQLYANYEANVKYAALEKLLPIMGSMHRLKRARVQ